jgi:hypothetical protein
MKKHLFLVLLPGLVALNSYAENYKLECSIEDTVIKIDKIRIFQNMKWWQTEKSPLDYDRFYIIFESDGKVTFKWASECDPNNQNITCSYTGWIRPSVFKRMANYLYQIRFLELKEKYLEDRDEEVDREKGYVIYFIDYNEKYVKKITDYRLDVPELKPFRNRVLKLKKKIKWTPVVNQ